MSYDRDGSISFLQEQLVKELLAETGMDASRPIGSRVNEAVWTQTSDSELLEVDEHAKYRSFIRSLIYIMNRTRPDLSVATKVLAPYLHALERSHMVSVNRVLCYSNGTKGKS